MQCVRCQKHFDEERNYFAHLTTEEHEENKSKELDPEEEKLLDKYN